MIECLRAASPVNLLRGLDLFDGVNGKLFGPSYEPLGKGSVLVAGMPPHQGEADNNPAQELVPSLTGTDLLIGHMVNEGEFFLAEFTQDWSLAHMGNLPHGFVRVLQERLVLQFFVRPRLGPAWEYYFGGHGYSNLDAYAQAARFLGDAKVRCPARAMADLVSRRGGRVYAYVLEATAQDVLPRDDDNETISERSERNATDFYRNPTHNFDAFVALGSALSGGHSVSDAVLAEARHLMRRWATFAKTG
ncbi:hypothetical protein HPB48_022630 [Haemaphysalis longicornis]|uniref:Carboxylesterase type B domain-containing protein n=1 Tax=Haemaphysalis longicornis TaxID=44386 RepID=A0A9J6G9D4_HAELO|nr:hypothetical protein HPB48_022630 [Haemaphysalis longicornis]